MGMIFLQSCDGDVMEVEKRAVLRSMSIAKKLQLRQGGLDRDCPIVLDKINSETLKKVIEYCNRHNVPFSVEDDETIIEALNTFDAQFVDVGPTRLFLLIKAAADLKIKTLMDLTCQTFLSKINKKNFEEIEESLKNWWRRD